MRGETTPGLPFRDPAARDPPPSGGFSRRNTHLMAEITQRLTSAIADRYQIEKHIGQGGMATVYLAHDIKHDRKVALKVLRPELAAVIGAERFLQEIKVTANLQHPNILPLYDSGEADTFLYYVMPFVEGDTLRDKLNREKQLGIEDAIEITKCVAAALDYAHRNDVIHRDIKPENILLHDGQALVADFGIALAVSAASGNRLTETGLSIGTPHYMSPEQAMGDRELDARSDVYSLGAMLYEMLAGEPPYTGSTAQAIVARVITEDPRPITLQRRTAPPHVAASVHKALNKLPADRFASAADFADALAKPGLSQAAPAATQEVVAPARTISLRLPSSAVAVPWMLFLGAFGLGIWSLLRPEAPPEVARFKVGLPPDTGLFASTNGATIAISPDGRSVVYLGPGRRLYVRTISQFGVRVLPGTDGAHTPFFSADGAWIGFYQSPNLKKVALAGGPPLTVTDATTMRGASWGDDDRIIYAPNLSASLLAVAASGGPVDTVTRLDGARGEVAHRWPDVLPGARAALFTVWYGSLEGAEIALVDLESGEVQRLFGGTFARYVNTGHIVYSTAQGALLAVPFDVGRLEVTGNPVALSEGLVVKTSGMGEFAMSAGGTLVYLQGEAAELSLVSVDRSGGQRVLAERLGSAFTPRVSADGNRIALRVTVDANQDIWIYDRDQGTMSRLTFEGSNDYPTWSPDGQHLYFTSVRGDTTGRDIYRRRADGSGAAELFLARQGDQWEIEIAPAGDVGVVRELGQETGRDLQLIQMDNGSLTPYVVTNFQERAAAISPDGRWLAYVSDESGQDEVYVRAFPEPSGRWQVSADGGAEPVWREDGQAIFYRHGEALVEATVRTLGAFAVGIRDTLFTGPFATSANRANYDLNRQTGEFVMIRSAVRASTELIVVLNWFEELRAMTGGGR